MSVRDHLAPVEARIAAACSRGGRRRDEVTLIAVSKTFPASAVEEALAAGIADIGENRVQEARDKKPLVSGGRWHLIGHLQSNKAKEAVQWFDVIQTVDSVSLAAKIGHAAAMAGKHQEVLLQVNLGNEPQKSGIDPTELDAIAKGVGAVDGLVVRGLMTIPPVGEPDETRRLFRELRQQRDRLGLEHLSMGMSDDFEIAIEEGSTMIRIGRALFGSRSH